MVPGFLYSTKRNHETKSRIEMTKSLNDNTGFGLVGLYKFLYFTKWVAGWTQNGTRLSSLIMLLFSRFKPCQYTRGETHTVGNYAARPVLKDVEL